jgi:tRNA A-37 threonylcarbamoyl transferase component Bud32
MQTLQQLKFGELKGAKRLTLSENLTTFPLEILELAESLEILDLSNNQLTEIPKEISKLKKLKIAFFSNNNFTKVPDSFKECKNLYMLGFKANKIKTFDNDILPLSISWLILTDNALTTLPNSMGKLTTLQKCGLSGNQLRELPQSMKNCRNLELIRLSANNLQEIPSWLLSLPKLSWLAFSGNPCSLSARVDMPNIFLKDIKMSELLGEGASGKIFKAYCKDLDLTVALKLFKGAVTSDGYAIDEMNACLSAGEHPNLIKVLAKIEEEGNLGLLMELIPSDYSNLGNPPTFNTCTRDTFDENCFFSIETILAIAKAIVSVSTHLHSLNIMHGDLYAHNILLHSDNSCFLGDLGAASFYDVKNENYEKIEVRAFGCLLDDLLSRVESGSSYEQLYTMLDVLRIKCMSENLQERPLFQEISF